MAALETAEYGETERLLEENTFRILELPKELRLQIYEYLLVPECIAVFSFDGVGAERTRSEEKITAVDEGPIRFYAKLVDCAVHPAILQTCSQLHAEASHLVYLPTTLELNPSRPGLVEEEVDDLKVHILDAPHLARIRRVSCLRVLLPVSSFTTVIDLAHSLALRNSLADGLLVQDLVVRLPGNSAANEEIMSGLIGAIVQKLEASKITLKAESAYHGFLATLWLQKIDGTWQDRRSLFEVDDMHGESIVSLHVRASGANFEQMRSVANWNTSSPQRRRLSNVPSLLRNSRDRGRCRTEA